MFDMFHIGHLNILKQAKQQCDCLIVGVTTDETVISYKNKIPVIPFNQRFEIMESIQYVDYVIQQRELDKFHAWEQLHFNVMFHGNEWQGTDLYNRYEKQFEKVGVRIEYLEPTKGISSSYLREIISHKK